MPLYTIGFKGSAIEDFIDVLNVYEVDLVIDLRCPSSRRDHRPRSKDYLPSALREAGIGYKYLEGPFLSLQTEDFLKRSGKSDEISEQKNDRLDVLINRLQQYIIAADNPVLLGRFGRPLHNAVFSRIATYLSSQGIPIHHLSMDAVAKEHPDLEDQLVDFYFRASGKYHKWSRKKLRQEALNRHKKETRGQ